MKAVLAALMIMAAHPCVAAEIKQARGAELRILDKLSGVVTDQDLGVGQSKDDGRLTIRLDDCRYPVDQPNGEAFAHLTITENKGESPIFKGWMIASSPALSALDHPRYDVWVLRCDVPEAAATDTATPDATQTGNGSGG